MRVRLLGAGNIGSALAREAVDLGLELEIVDTDPARSKALADELGAHAVEPGAGLDLDGVDLVIEAATQEAVAGPVVEALEAGVDALVMTTGAFADQATLERARAACEQTGARCHIPSGGIAGLDGVKALALEEGARVELTTRKPPTSLDLPPDTDRELFSGTASEAVAKFPKNVNVAASLVLAGLSPEVRIVADPSLDRNTHQVRVISPRVTVEVQVASAPSQDNPATSQIAVLSARAMLRRIVDPFQVGT